MIKRGNGDKVEQIATITTRTCGVEPRTETDTVHLRFLDPEKKRVGHIRDAAVMSDNRVISGNGSVPLNNAGLKVALVQMSVGADKSRNINKAVSEIKSASKNGVQMVVLPECFNSPYGTNYFNDYSEEVPNGETCKALSKAAESCGVCVVGGTLPERCGDKLFNTCTVWDNHGKLLATHRKMHLFDIDIPGKMTFKESEVLSAGDSITMFDYLGVKVGLGICYDLRFHEMAHLLANQGCQFLIYPSAFNMTTGKIHWELLGRARAIDQQCWVALVSPARDTSASYVAWGHTTLIDPWGAVIKSLKEKPGQVIATINTSVVDEVRRQIPIRNQRRTDVYDTVRKN